ncbi:LysR family transcriptional regulator [Cellvibrio sp. pealriver]|uniref:LysR family transcriptional regulator n=1 Tax=Cellvibrio sp. pealriver TaxID=1622269 RepID=UPI00066FEA28|nr:LysR family transcriptional regulator [Cellvibrio sp. pealriver]
MPKAYSLQDLEFFLRVAESGNMSETARQMNITNAAVSAAIKRLELALDVNLIERTTRSLHLSAAGQSLIPYVQQALAVLDDAESELRNLQTAVAGEISVGLPSDLGRHLLLDILDEFQQQFPRVSLRLDFSDFMQDLYRDNLDMVIRYGELKDSSLVARKLCDNQRILAASPAYIARMPPLDSLEDLVHHNCLYFYRNDRPYNQWIFYRDGKTIEIPIQGNRHTNDGEVVRRWGLAGQGIVYKSALDLSNDIAQGRLVKLLEGQYQGQLTPVYAVYKQRKYQPYRLTALLNHFENKLKQKIIY